MLKQGWSWSSVLFTRTTNMLSFPCFQRLPWWCPPLLLPVLGLGKQMSGAAAERVIVREDELNPTQEMNAIMKHNVRRANPVDAICPPSLERWLETPKKGEQLITSSLFKAGFLFDSVMNWWMELFCITAVISFFFFRKWIKMLGSANILTQQPIRPSAFLSTQTEHLYLKATVRTVNLTWKCYKVHTAVRVWPCGGTTSVCLNVHRDALSDEGALPAVWCWNGAT